MERRGIVVLSIVGLGLGTATLGDNERATDFYQCDRQCRWVYGFFNRNVIGRRVAKWSDKFDARGNYCKCFDLKASAVTPLGGGKLLDRFSKKPFDSTDTWSGNFSSQFVCTATPQGGLETMLQDEALRQKRDILHCGKCAVCSAKKDAVVLSLSRKWITEVMTAASSSFAKPRIMGGHGNLTRLQNNLFDLGMNFSMTPQVEFGDTSCMECWTDNIMSDANTCKKWCWTKFFTPSNPRVDITKCSPFDLNCQCLKCDEDYSGAQFIKCAGANRRSTGIVSDIARPDYQQCKVGMYYGISDADLPTAPKPSKAEIDKVLHPEEIVV